MHLRPIRALRDVNRNLTEQLQAERAAEEAARFEITRSATQFSRRSKEVVEGTINLSAVLMRAGEVDEANRLLAEAEREVRTEEAVLIETVNEVRAEGIDRRSRITRLKLLKMLATAFLGGSLMVCSAFGVAVAKFLTEGPESAGARGSAQLNGAGDGERRSDGRTTARRVLVPGTDMRVSLSGKQLAQYLSLKNDPDANVTDLRDFLLGLAPDELVNRVASSVASTAARTQAGVAKAVADVTDAVKDQAPSAPKEESPGESPSASPSESPDDDNGSPTPTPSESEEPTEGSEEENEEEGNTMLPSPLPGVAEPGQDN